MTMFELAAIMLAGVSAMSDAPPERALSLEIEETAGFVGISLVARSPVAQKVEYTVELVGTSNSRHKGSTVIPAAERRVLSQMHTAVRNGDEWCARVDVREQNGESYTLSAGDCAAD